MTLSVVYAIFFYAATLLLIVRVVRKMVIYARTPTPLKIPVIPAPITKTGVIWRMTKEVTVFQSLFKACKWTWLFGWMFHVALALVLLSLLYHRNSFLKATKSGNCSKRITQARPLTGAR